MFNEPEHIVQWGHASETGTTTKAINDLRVGGTFSYRMEAKDGSAGFDLTAVYDEISPSQPHRLHDGAMGEKCA